MGRVLGMEYFCAPERNADALAMEREIKRAAKRDRDEQKNTTTVLRIQSEGLEQPSESKAAVVKWVLLIRREFQGFVIRRSSKSMDGNGCFISGLAPFTEHSLTVELYDHEYEYLEKMASGPQEKVSVSVEFIRNSRTPLLWKQLSIARRGRWAVQHGHAPVFLSLC